MAVTLNHLPFRTHSTWGSWLKELAQWLTGVHGTYNGPGWELIEVDDTTLREVPSGTTSDDLTGGNLWNPANGTPPPVGSWVVLQTLPGAIAPNNVIQIMFFVDDTDEVHAYMFVLADFATGGGTTGGTPPSVPSTSSVTTSLIREWDGYMRYYALADQSMLSQGCFLESDADSQRWHYVGEMDVPASFGTESEPRNKYPFVLRNSFRGGVTGDSTTTEWKARHPADVNIEIGNARTISPMRNPSDLLLTGSTYAYQEFEGVVVPHIFGVNFNPSTSAGVGFWGYLRHNYVVHSFISGPRFTSGLRHFITMNQVDIAGHSALLMIWDETTGLPTGPVSG